MANVRDQLEPCAMSRSCLAISPSSASLNSPRDSRSAAILGLLPASGDRRNPVSPALDFQAVRMPVFVISSTKHNGTLDLFIPFTWAAFTSKCVLTRRT